MGKARPGRRSDISAQHDGALSTATPLVPGEEEQARAIARQMITFLTNPSLEAVQTEYDVLVKTNFIGRGQVVTALLELLEDPVPLTRLGAAIRLLRMNEVRRTASLAIKSILDASGVDDGTIQLKTIAASLLSTVEEIPDELHSTLARLLQKGQRRVTVAVAVVMRDTPEAVSILGRALWDEQYGLAFMAAKGLIKRGVRIDDAVNRLIFMLGKVSEEFDGGIIAELSKLPAKAVQIGPVFVAMLKDPMTTPMMRTVVASALGKIGHGAVAQAEFERLLVASLQSEDWETVCAASAALKDLGAVSKKVIHSLVKLLSSPILEARAVAALILADFGNLASNAVPALFECVNREQSIDVLAALMKAIQTIGLPDHPTDPHFFETTIAALVEQARVEQNVDLIPYRLAMFSLFGTRAVPDLLRVAQTKTLAQCESPSVRWRCSAWCRRTR